MMNIGENKLTYSRNIGQGALAGYNVAINVFDGLSRLNHKHHEWTTRDGHLKGVLCDLTVRVTAGETFETDFYGLGNTWTVRNAFRKFHFLREQMFRDAGVTRTEMGKYSHTLRPKLLPDSKFTGTVNASFDQTFPGARLTTDVWANSTVDYFTVKKGQLNGGGTDISNNMDQTLDYTRLVSAVPIVEMDTQGKAKLYDEWDLHIILEHEVQDTVNGEDQWTSVSMLQAYLEDRQAEIPDATATSAITAQNPLAALASQAVSSGEVTEIASEQQLEEPPYDITHEIYSSGVQLANKGTFSIASAFFDSATWSGVAQQTIRNVFLPSGWLTFYSRVNNFDLEVDVKGIFECRDVI